ncbi:hypothetical protein GS454_04695 [Rhodococcus hoagii]|nr:hypothetical protein [Prescottella equi]
MSQTPLIAAVLLRYFPDWEPPHDTGRKWLSTKCPFHGESNESASVSYELNAFRCHGCGAKGDAYSIIQNQEEVNFATALELAARVSPGSHRPVPAKPARVSRRRVFGDSGTDSSQHSAGGRRVHARVRGRPSAWT